MARRPFQLAVRAFAEKTGANMDLACRKIAADCLGRIVLRTAVDTGRARGNWQLTKGTPAIGTVPRLDRSGAPTVAAGAAQLNGFRAGPSIWIVNNLPYIERLEYEGWSRQSPNGMVRITVREYQGIVRDAVRGLR